MTSTIERLSTQPDPVEPARWSAGLRVTLRRSWRVLTSMRTALVLLFLLAVAAVPGSLLPQRSLNAAKVTAYYTDHPTLGPILGRLGFFDVFSSPWFAAIYLLLFVSLIGCLVPRIRLHARALRSAPPPVPQRLDRLPESAVFTRIEDGRTAEDLAAAAAATLRRRHWRVIRRERDGVLEVSAEKGYLRETGNLVFHISLVALLVGLAVGKLFGYEGSVLVQEGQGFCNSFQAYDNYRNGPFVSAADLTPLCADLNSFTVDYETNLTPSQFLADITYSTTLGGADRKYQLKVNSPLRTDGVRLYLTGHGYAPIFTITYPDGSTFSDISAPFLPTDQATLQSEGVVKLPDGPDSTADSTQLAIQGLFLPTAVESTPGVLVSVDPRPRNPAVGIIVYTGSLGLDSGQPQNVYTLDQRQIDRGVLQRTGAANLLTGQSLALPDGTTIRFDGYRQWTALQLSHDPGQITVLIAAILMLVGLLGSLRIRRRRAWVRITPDPESADPGPSRTVISVGGLARTDAGSFGTEFAGLVAALAGPDARTRKD